ncbi:ComF family protein [Clostridium sp. 19966]|uniref:ComF family protein n=1 Tax=Clostridium sp. 19966 TaxID=2768166 RepID=UPI0028DE7A45|nr:phosphoribosyltransferase family protein [Clostridium sp. 19966]MDT8715571.1 ComF family protein [Clostridium sp. 19966]
MGKRFALYIKYILSSIIDAVYGEDENCHICGEYAEESPICSSCRKSIAAMNIEGRIEKDGFNIVYYSASYYADIIKEMVIRLKYKSDFEVGRVLAELIIKLIQNLNIQADLITFVPSSKENYSSRGFNQSEFLCKLVADEVNVTKASLLIKNLQTKDQIGLDANQRWDNLRGSFTVINKNKVINKKIIIIDDVITTGATAHNCGSELIKCGAKEVIVLTVAKSTV